MDYLDFLRETDQTLGNLARRDPPAVWREVVVDRKTGLARQAGADAPEGEAIKLFRSEAESSLFVFSVGVMGRTYLTGHFHRETCEFLQKVPPFRKLLLLPRDHAKTSIVSHCLPLHILVQPPESNIYFPGFPGNECRILLCGESATRAESNLRVIRTALESNQTFKALWPELVWESARRQAKKWNDQQLIIPRRTEYPDPSIYAIGVGGAITGSRPNVVIKDDLISVEAANSDTVMDSVIEWHRVSRALMDEYEKSTGLESLEFIIGTRWAVYDLYSYVMSSDPTVEYLIRAIVEDSKHLWPERFNEKRVEQLRVEFGTMFYLLYMNTTAAPELTDFDMEMVRECNLTDVGVEFDADEQDALLEERMKRGEVTHTPALRGQRLNAHTWETLLPEGTRGEYLRFKYG